MVDAAVLYNMSCFVALTANLTAWGLLHWRFKSFPLQSRRWRKCPYKSIRCAIYISEVAQMVEHESTTNHVLWFKQQLLLSYHTGVVVGSSPTLTIWRCGAKVAQQLCWKRMSWLWHNQQLKNSPPLWIEVRILTSSFGSDCRLW